MSARSRPPHQAPNTGLPQRPGVDTTGLVVLTGHTKISFLPPGSLLMDSRVVRFSSFLVFLGSVEGLGPSSFLLYILLS